MTTPRHITRCHKGLFITTGILFAASIPHAVFAFALDLPLALVNLHFVSTLLVAGLGWRAEAIDRQRKRRKRSHRKVPHRGTSRYDEELLDLDLRLRGLDGLI